LAATGRRSCGRDQRHRSGRFRQDFATDPTRTSPGAVVLPAAWGRKRRRLPDRGQSTLTGGANRVGVRLPDQWLRRPRRDAGPTGNVDATSARERHTGERRPAPAGSRLRTSVAIPGPVAPCPRCDAGAA
jgi:hypothetical protein